MQSSLLRGNAVSSRPHTGGARRAPRAIVRNSPLRAEEDGSRGSSATEPRTTVDQLSPPKDDAKPSNGETPSSTSGKAPSAIEELQAAAAMLPEEEARAISEAYKFLVQHPEAAQLRSINFREVERLYTAYQTILWRPAELLNGRLAMIGFSAGLVTTLATGQSVWEQVYRFPFAYLGAFTLVAGAQYLNRYFGSPQEGIEVGPVKFSRKAELYNARGAMMGYAILAFIQYRQDMAKAAWYAFQQLSQSGRV